MHAAKGLCHKHYYRLQRTGQLEPRDRLHIRRTNETHPAPTLLDTPCRLWQGRTKGPYGGGYGVKDIPGRGYVLMHRWVMEQVYGIEAIAGLLVMHRCDNPPCYRFDHLRLGTHADNAQDMAAKGRNVGFEPNTGARLRLSPADVSEIRRRYEVDGERQSELARAFGLHPSTVSKIVHYRARRHV